MALAEEGGLKLAEMVAEILRAGPGLSLARAYEMSDQLRDQAPFETFMGLLQRGVAAAVIAQALGRLAAETEAVNMDRRQALVAGLALFRAA